MRITVEVHEGKSETARLWRGMGELQRENLFLRRVIDEVLTIANTSEGPGYERIRQLTSELP